MKEYKVAKGWAIFIYVVAPLMIGLFGWLLILPFQNGNFSPNLSWTIIPVSISMIAVIVIGVIDTYKARLIIRDDRMQLINIFSNRELKFDEIKGFTVNEQYIFVEPSDKQKKRIKISKYVGGYSEILHWVSQTFPDLEVQNAIEEEQDILKDENFGWTKEVREEKLLKARQTCKIINWTAGIAFVWTFFYPKPYQYSILAAIVIPVLALLVVKFFDGLIRVNERKGSAYPSVISAFIGPSLGLGLRGLLDFDIFDYANVWPATILIMLAFLFLILFKQKEIIFKDKRDYLTVSSLAIFLFAYAFGTVIHINCYYDNSEPQHFKPTVLDKRISSGKSTSYYIELSAWGKQKEVDEARVDKELYNRIEVGDEVNVYFKNGKLEIPWFIVSD